MEEAKKEDIGLLFKNITDRIRSSADRSFAAFGLTGTQVQYLAYLTQCGGSATQRSLEERFDVSHPTVIGIVSRLREKGFVSVTMDERDRRSRIVSLTQKAHDVDESLGRGRKQMDQRLVEGFSEEEKEQLRAYLLRILDNAAMQEEREGEKS